jgi:hypothetical protein
MYIMYIESCYKAVKAEGDNDPAVARAMTIIQNKLNSQLGWSKNYQGDIIY